MHRQHKKRRYRKKRRTHMVVLTGTNCSLTTFCLCESMCPRQCKDLSHQALLHACTGRPPTVAFHWHAFTSEHTLRHTHIQTLDNLGCCCCCRCCPQRHTSPRLPWACIPSARTNSLRRSDDRLALPPSHCHTNTLTQLSPARASAE